jgi:Abortive infection alpha
VNNASKVPAAARTRNNRLQNGNLAAANASVGQRLSALNELVPDWTNLMVFVQTTIAEAVAFQRIPADRLLEPRLDIAVPALEAIRYSALKREFALLIASTMDPARTDKAHPAFVEFLRQLTQDEVNLVASLPDPAQVLPMVNLHLLNSDGTIASSLRHIIPLAYARRCDRKSGIPGYIDNLTRLNIISIPAQLQIKEEAHYRDLLKQSFVSKHVQSIQPPLKPKIERELVRLTEFGQQFRKCCMSVQGPPA